MAKRRPSGDGMVRKREDGRWEGRIVVGHKQNGEPIFRYVLAKTQKELLDKLHRDLEAFQDVELTEDSRMTLGEWLDRWMEDYGAATLRPNTLRSYEQFIRCYIKPYLGDKIVSRVTRMDIQKLYRKLKHEGRVREHPEHGHELSDTMVLRIHAMLHRCLKDAEAAHVIARNPTDGAVVPKASYKPKQIPTKEQMETFLAAVERNEIWRDFFYTELTTGLRRGEICGLMWQDFDEKAGTLKVLRSVNVPKAGGLERGRRERFDAGGWTSSGTARRWTRHRSNAWPSSWPPSSWTPSGRRSMKPSAFGGCSRDGHPWQNWSRNCSMRASEASPSATGRSPSC